MKDQRMMIAALTLFALVSAGPASKPVWGAGLPKSGDTLPSFGLQAPESPVAIEYLGIGQPRFQLKDIPCRLLLVEIIGVYCPQCYQQAPIFNTLFNRIEKGKLKGQVKMLAIAAGGTPTEVNYLFDQGKYRFPVVPDEQFEVHQLLGEPRTPFTLLVDPEGKVVYTHMGIIENVDAFLKLLNESVR